MGSYSKPMNIYFNGEYYYSERPYSRGDKIIEKAVSLDYGFNYCARRNFGAQINLGNKGTINSGNWINRHNLKPFKIARYKNKIIGE